jgi:hypothetical protein
MATMTAIQTVTVGAGGAASISFSNIPQTYTDLCIVVSSRKSLSTGLGYSSINFNGDTGSNYGYVFLNGAGTTVYQNLSSPATFLFFSSDDQANTANTFGSASIYIPNYVSNIGFKSVYTHCVSENNSAASAYMDIHSGLWRSTSSITSVVLADLVTGSSFVQYSTATLYGVFRGPEVKPTTPTIGTATAGSQSASVTFTPTSATNVDASYTVLSSPGSITASGTSSPITVRGLTDGTSYTFQVRANNPSLSTAYSSASNSVTPSTPVIPLLGAWTTAASTTPSSAGDGYYGQSLVSSEPRVFNFGGGRSPTNYYNDGKGGTWFTSGADRPVGQGLGCSSKAMTNSGLFYTYGGDTGNQTLVYSTSTGGSWTAQSGIPYNAGWGDGTYFEQSGNKYLIACGEYPTGNTAARATVAVGGTLSWTSITSYPIYASAPRFARLTSVAVGMGGFNSPSLSATNTNVYSYSASANSWTSETALPFTPSGGYIPAASLVGPADTRIYISNGGTSLWSRGDASGTWRSETATPNTWAQGWGITTSTGTMYLQLSNAGNTFYQIVS